MVSVALTRDHDSEQEATETIPNSTEIFEGMDWFDAPCGFGTGLRALRSTSKNHQEHEGPEDLTRKREGSQDGTMTIYFQHEGG